MYQKSILRVWSVVALKSDLRQPGGVLAGRSRVGALKDLMLSSRRQRKVTTVTINPEFGNVTGTKDKDYDIIWFTEACLSNVLRLETYIEDAGLAGDAELADFFRRAQHESRKGAEEGKKLLAKRLAVHA